MIIFFNVVNHLSSSIRYLLLLAFTIFAACLPEQACSQNSKIDSLQLLLKQDIDDTVRIDLYMQLIDDYFKLNIDSAGLYAYKLLELSKSIKNQKGLKFAYDRRGFYEESKGNYYGANSLYLSWLKISELSQDSLSQLHAYIALSYLKTNMKEYEMSLEYSKKSLVLSRKLGDRYIWNVYNTIGLAFKEMNQIDSAIHYYNISKSFALKQASEHGILFSMGNLAEVLIINRKYNDALISLDSVIYLSLKLKDYNSTSLSFFNKSYIYTELSKQKNINRVVRNNFQNLAIENAEKALAYAEKKNYLEHKKNAYKQLFVSYAEKKMYDKALYCAEKTMQAQDSIFNSEKASAIEREKYRNKMNIIKRGKINQENIIKKQIIVIRATTIASIVIILLFVLLIIMFIKQRRQHRLMQEINNDIEQKNIEIISAEEDLRQVNSELVSANNMKNHFFSLLANDLKTPFNTMIGFSELISLRAKAGEYDDVNKYVNVLIETSRSTFDLLENLLIWAQLQRNLVKNNPKILKVNNIVREVEMNLKQFLISKGITLKNSVEKDAIIFADYFMIHTIFRNLVYNSIKFTNNGGQISITASYYDNKINIVIADTGIGITKNTLQNLFKHNVKSTSGTENEKRTGLGLLICKEFAIMNGGDLSVSSVVGEGTSVNLSLLKSER